MRSSPLRCPCRLAWAGTLCLLIATGCSPLASPEEKARSLRNYSFLPVEGRSLPRYAALRSALLIRGAEPVLIQESSQGRTFAFRKSPQKNVAIGTAACLAPDGYFLTAAHNLQESEPFYLAIRRDEQSSLTIFPGILIWRGDQRDDLALVWIDSQGLEPFEWAPLEAIEPDSAVLTWGLEPSAGAIRRPPLPIEDHPGLTRHVLLHTAPLREGDSGGPLVDDQGRLLGVNIGRSWYFLTGQSTALRPDPARLDQWIQTHRSRRRHASRDRQQRPHRQ